jgi:phosphoesterase RecJ-like protein
MAKDIDYATAIAELRRARRIVLTTHVKPDGDALGSIAALRRWLLGQGKTVEVVLPSPAPSKYAFLNPDGAWKTVGRDVDFRTFPAPDLIGVLDTCTWLQLSGVEPLFDHSRAPVLVIDHHRTQDALADFLLADPDAAATAVLIHRLFVEASAVLDADIATYLFAALASDTDWFRLPSVDAEIFRLAASLVEAGAPPSLIHEKLYLNDDPSKVRLLGRAIETLRTALDGRVTLMRLTQALFRESGADVGDTENLINECMKVRGTQVGLLLIESDKDEVRVSLRAKPPIDVLSVAEHFGGGGHRRAAGARLKGSLDQVEATVLAAVAGALGCPESAWPPDARPL